MKFPTLRRWSLVAVVLCAFSFVAAPASLTARQAPPARPGSGGQAPPAAGTSQWESDIRKFEAADSITPPPKGGVVFIGSSSIVRWNLAEAFPDLGARAINRGFGRSVMADTTRYADRIVIPYAPHTVVLYSGDNDLGSTDTPAQIAGQFEAFAEKVHATLPQTRIIFVSIKPSLARWAMIEKARAANAIVREYVKNGKNLTYMDIEPQMLGADGKPRPELYVTDGLHMTPAGYTILERRAAAALGN